MLILTLAKKDLRLLVRDARAMIILLAMPLIFILVLGVSLGENFGKPASAGLRVSVLVEDQGVPRFFDRPAMIRDGVGLLAITPNPASSTQAWAGCSLALANRPGWFPHDSWSHLLIRDLNETAEIHVEFIANRAEAERLVNPGQRAAVLVLGKHFSKRIERCSFLASGWQDGFNIAAVYPRPGDPITLAMRGLFDESQDVLPMYINDGLNPFHRDGVNLKALDVEVLKDDKQQTAAAIIDQLAQGSLLRVIMPWMIGRAFDKIGDPAFLTLLGKEEQLPFAVKTFLTSPIVSRQQKLALSTGLQNSLQNLFPRYNLTAKTWAALTKENEIISDRSGHNVQFAEDGAGWLKRGGSRYQQLVPSSLVMFAFFLVLTVGWLFVAERRQGTLKRLVVAPLTKADILIGKMLPCLLISLFQGFFLLGAGKLIFNMSWGVQPLWLIPVVAATSFAAMGLAMLVASLSRTETQVAIYGTLLVLVLAFLSGCMIGDRALMPPQMQQITQITPHAWALDAYKELLTVANRQPHVELIVKACGVLTGFGAAFLALAWWFLRLDADS
jgi:ABC-type multidrug transport system permease subunit